jgi:hypothetical protein
MLEKRGKTAAAVEVVVVGISTRQGCEISENPCLHGQAA